MITNSVPTHKFAPSIKSFAAIIRSTDVSKFSAILPKNSPSFTAWITKRLSGPKGVSNTGPAVGKIDVGVVVSVGTGVLVTVCDGVGGFSVEVVEGDIPAGVSVKIAAPWSSPVPIQ